MTNNRYRARLAYRCKIHDKPSVRIDGPYGRHTYGCEDCVKAWAADIERIRKPRRRVHLATGLKRTG